MAFDPRFLSHVRSGAYLDASATVSRLWDERDLTQEFDRVLTQFRAKELCEDDFITHITALMDTADSRELDRRQQSGPDRDDLMDRDGGAA